MSPRKVKTSETTKGSSKYEVKKPKRTSFTRPSYEALQVALNAIGNGMTYRAAVKKFQTARSTLCAKKNNHLALDSKKGPATVLYADEEEAVVDWIIYSQERGFPVSEEKLLDCVQQYLTVMQKKTPFKNNRPGKHWYQAFFKRHKELSVRIAQHLTLIRASVNEEDIRQWFTRIKPYFESKKLLGIYGYRIFNLDESAFMLVPKDDAVIAKKVSRTVYRIVGANEKATITVLFTANAAGRLLPPMVLFDLKNVPKKSVFARIPTGWGVGNIVRGWMTSNSFYDFLTNVFFKWLSQVNL